MRKLPLRDDYRSRETKPLIDLLEERCQSPAIHAALTSYAFHDLDQDERADIALHLVECDACWQEVQQIERCVAALRFDPDLTPIAPNAEVVSVFGLSGRLDRPFGGHVGFIRTIATLFGLLYAASIWTELAYSYDRFGMLAWTLSPVAWLWAASVLALALAIDARQSAKGRDSGFLWSVGVVVGGIVTLVLMLSYLLPDAPTIQASFRTRSAAAGYQKNVIQYFLPLLLFVLPTFHAIVRLQRELRLGRYPLVIDLLAGSPQALTPRGVWLVPLWLLVVVLMVAVFIGYQGTNNMLDNLVPGTYANLFSSALYLRVGFWYAAALTCIVWYQTTLNELKRECVAANTLLNDSHRRPS